MRPSVMQCGDFIWIVQDPRHGDRPLLYSHAFRHRLRHDRYAIEPGSRRNAEGRRRLVLIVREAPLHAGHLRSMLAGTENGAIIVPPVPAFYHQPKSIDDVVNQTVGPCLDLFDIDVGLVKRWTGS